MFPQYSSNMSLINPQDVQGLMGSALPNQSIPGMNMDVMRQAQMMPNQMTAPQQGMNPQDKMAAYRMMAGALQGMAPRQQIPSGNTAQIMRDQSRPQFAGYIGGGQVMNPQQQMAMALRNRG